MEGGVALVRGGMARHLVGVVCQPEHGHRRVVRRHHLAEVVAVCLISAPSGLKDVGQRHCVTEVRQCGDEDGRGPSAQGVPRHEDRRAAHSAPVGVEPWQHVRLRIEDDVQVALPHCAASAGRHPCISQIALSVLDPVGLVEGPPDGKETPCLRRDSLSSGVQAPPLPQEHKVRVLVRLVALRVVEGKAQRRHRAGCDLEACGLAVLALLHGGLRFEAGAAIAPERQL
mmetsp:Transcript_67474/g.213508  ORF Transcript_67474/g.213508 Transcript_67474/m.213508 type:complete len:228 (+) Transcript_67474:614-1297(+)